MNQANFLLHAHQNIGSKNIMIADEDTQQIKPVRLKLQTTMLKLHLCEKYDLFQ